MNPTILEISIALMMVLAAVVLFIWFRNFRRGGSERRMRDMLINAGLDPEIIDKKDTDVLIKEVRSRCRKCQAEDVCERWLAGDTAGDNDFCPNAGVFRMLAEQAEVAK